MVLSESSDPAAPVNATLSILVEGDDATTKTRNEIHQPDNLESTPNSLLVTEDPSSGNQFLTTDTDTRKTNACVWRVPLTAPGTAGTPEVVLEVDQSLEGNTDPAKAPVDVTGPDTLALPVAPLSPGRLGAWEASGVVDASAVWGPGWFLVDVQAHSYWVAREPDPNLAGFTRKREGGQLLAVHIPGA